MNEQYEVEVKVELTADVWATLDRRLVELGAIQSEVELETWDAYLFASPVMVDRKIDYSFVRLRYDKTTDRNIGTVGVDYDITMKEWSVINGVWVRAEAKGKHSAAQHYELYSGGSWPKPPKYEIYKKRDEYCSRTFGWGLGGRDVTIALDQATLTRGGGVRFFIEVECITADKSEVPQLRESILLAIAGILNVRVEEIKPSPSYFALAVEGE